MPKRRSRLLDYAVYLAVRLVVCLVQALSWRLALRLGDWLGRAAYRLNRRHRLVAADNLRHTYPALSAMAIDRLVRATYCHWTTTVVEMIRLPRALRRSNMERYFQYADPADYDRALHWVQSGRPLIALTGHFGSFEVMSYMLGLWGIRAAVIARRIDNPHLDRYLKRFRQRTGQQVLDKNLDYPIILETLAAGGVLGMVGDQDAGPRGLFVEFLGRPASTFKSIALLSLEYRAPILVLGAARVGHPLHYHLYLEDIILPEEYAHDPAAARAITQRYSDGLARMVRRHPEQYFWVHRRWKHQPKARTKAA